MKTLILSVMWLGLVQSANADIAYFQLTCDSTSAKTVTEFTISGVSFYQANFIAEGVIAKVANDQAILTATDGTEILLGNVISESACGPDGSFSAQVSIDSGVEAHKEINNKRNCYPFTTDGNYAVDQAFQLNLVSGTSSIRLATEYTSDFELLEDCQAAAR